MESYLLLLLGPVGFGLLIFGIWLFHKGKEIEKRVYSKYDPKAFYWWSPTGWLGMWTWAHSQDSYAPWGRYNTRPFAYFCVIVGIVFFVLFAMSVI